MNDEREFWAVIHGCKIKREDGGQGEGREATAEDIEMLKKMLG